MGQTQARARLSRLAFLFILGCPLALSQQNVLSLSGDEQSRNISPYTTYLRDPTRTLTVKQVLAQEFAALPEGRTAFGYTSDLIWLRFALENASEQTLVRLLRTNARFMRPLEIYRLDNGNPRRVFHNDETQNFSDRPLPALRFLAHEFSLQPGQQSQFLIRFGAGGQAAMAMDIVPLEAALAEQTRASVGIALFVATLLTLILVNFFHYLAVRRLAYLIYVFYEAFHIVYISHLEGFTFQYVWPSLPDWNADATPLIAAGGLVIGNLFAMVFLDVRRHAPILARLFQAFMVMAGVAFFATLLVSSRVGNQMLTPLLPASLGLSLIAAAVMVRQGHYLARYFLVAWSLFAVGGLTWSGTLLGWFNLDVNVLTVYKVTIAIQAIVLSMGLADQFRRLQNQYNQTQASLIESLESRLKESRARLQLEIDNEQAMSALLEKSKQLAAASHDINQPIQSLRLAVEALDTQTEDKEATARLHRTLSHMESVLGSTLDVASQEIREGERKRALKSIVAGHLLRDLRDEFQAIATRKSLEIRAFDSQAVLVIRDQPLRRCLANLVSNALNNTDAGGILLGTRRRAGRLLFQVFDTGRGFASDETAEMLQPLARGATSTGHGLGLTIVREICEEYGWRLAIDSTPGAGSCVSIAVPVRT